MFKVSVIIPVYNAAPYIKKAVESAVHEPEVGEIILIDDGYPDGAAEICRQLVATYDKVRFFQHPNNENRGAAASRNLGINMANYGYVAFLDADDYFLSGRFKCTVSVFADNPNIDAVYEPVGIEYVNEQARRDFCAWRGLSWKESAEFLTYPLKPLYGKEFFHSLLEGNNGHPHTDGITVKKKLFEKSGLFNEQLKLHQDAEMWIRMAYYGTFTSGGHSNPVAIRLAHLENRITKRNYQSMYLLNKSIYEWSRTVVLDKKALRAIAKNYIASRYLSRYNGNDLRVKIGWRLRYFGTLLVSPRYW